MSLLHSDCNLCVLSAGTRASAQDDGFGLFHLFLQLHNVAALKPAQTQP